MTAHRTPFLLIALGLLLAGSSIASAEECSVTRFGDGVSLEETSAAAEILSSPEEWEGRTVRVEGTVEGVCQLQGCWIEIVARDGGDAMRVKVEDGVIVFPTAAHGRHAAAQGTVEFRELTAEQWENRQRHLAEEQGEPFDPATLGDGPYRVVQVKGTGAEICM